MLEEFKEVNKVLNISPNARILGTVVSCVFVALLAAILIDLATDCILALCHFYAGLLTLSSLLSSQFCDVMTMRLLASATTALRMRNLCRKYTVCELGLLIAFLSRIVIYTMFMASVF